MVASGSKRFLAVGVNGSDARIGALKLTDGSGHQMR